jgi:DNA-binding PadR family transcriptional regulator
MSKLETAGYIEVEKAFVNKKPRTMLRLTDEGRAAFREHVQTMKQVFDACHLIDTTRVRLP